MLKLSMTDYKYDFSDRTNSFYWQTNRQITVEELEEIFVNREQKTGKTEAKNATQFALNQIKDPRTIKEVQDRIAQGNINSIFPIILNNNDDNDDSNKDNEFEVKLVIRMHPKGVKNGYFHQEKLLAKLIKKNKIPTYETLYVGDNSSKLGFDFTLTNFVNGTPMSLIKDLQENKTLDENYTFQTGKFMAKINQIKTKGFGSYKLEDAKQNKLVGQFKTLYQHITAGLEQDLDYLVKNETIDEEFKNKIKEIFETHKEIFNLKQGYIIHNDIADWNILVNEKTQKVVGMMDLDESFSGDPVMDISAWSLFFSNERLDYLLKGYKSVTKLPHDFEIRFHIYRLRYLVSKMHLRTRRFQIKSQQEFLTPLIKRGLEVLNEEKQFFSNK